MARRRSRRLQKSALSGSGVPLEEQLRRAVAKELAQFGEFLPPWLKHPELLRGSMGWRMGYGEWYLDMWHEWAKSQERTQLLVYFRAHAPLPVEWLDWVSYVLGHHEVFDFILEPEERFVGIRFLADEGLADYEAFMQWWASREPQLGRCSGKI